MPDAVIDWDVWKQRLVSGLDFAGDGVAFRDLFADGGLFEDPANPPTADIAEIEKITLDFCADWYQDVTSFRHGDDWVVFEWTGYGTFTGLLPAGPAGGVKLSMTGMTMIHLNATGEITSYRDYLDRKEVEDQIKAAATKT